MQHLLAVENELVQLGPAHRPQTARQQMLIGRAPAGVRTRPSTPARGRPATRCPRTRWRAAHADQRRAGVVALLYQVDLGVNVLGLGPARDDDGQRARLAAAVGRAGRPRWVTRVKRLGVADPVLLADAQRSSALPPRSRPRAARAANTTTRASCRFCIRHRSERGLPRSGHQEAPAPRRAPHPRRVRCRDGPPCDDLGREQAIGGAG